MTNLISQSTTWQPSAGPSLVLGAGGAARAILVALLDAGVPKIYLCNRTRSRAENLAADKNVPFLGALPLVQSVREAADVGRPAALQEATPIQQTFTEVTQNLVTQLLKRNTTLPPTKAVAITNMVGCAAIK